MIEQLEQETEEEIDDPVLEADLEPPFPPDDEIVPGGRDQNIRYLKQEVPIEK